MENNDSKEVLGALLDVLKDFNAKSERVDAWMSKQESRDAAEMEDRKRREEAERLEKSRMDETARWDAMQKNITSNIIAFMKDFNGLLGVDGKTPHKVDGGDVSIPVNDKWPASKRTVQEDIEVPAKLRTDISEVQKPIQAMHNGVPHEDGDMTEEYPMTEKTGVMPSVDELRMMISQLLDEKLMDVRKSMSTENEMRLEKTLKNIGYKEERGLAGPKNVPVTEKTTPIAKSEDTTVLTQERLDSATNKELAEAWLVTLGLGNFNKS